MQLSNGTLEALGSDREQILRLIEQISQLAGELQTAYGYPFIQEAAIYVQRFDQEVDPEKEPNRAFTRTGLHRYYNTLQGLPRDQAAFASPVK